jgi:hypothetical protein
MKPLVCLFVGEVHVTLAWKSACPLAFDEGARDANSWLPGLCDLGGWQQVQYRWLV